MTHGVKPDAAEISAWMDQLPQSLRLVPPRAYWPRWAYHFTSLGNAASIIRSGHIYSRDRCATLDIQAHDTADREIIGLTPAAHRFVRLYFRPRTPMQYGVEGVLPRHSIRHGAHCPAPVFFLFPSARLIGQESVAFSNGNFARTESQLGSTAVELMSLPFREILSSGPMLEATKNATKFHRQAEILVSGPTITGRCSMDRMPDWSRARHTPELARVPRRRVARARSGC